MIDLPAMLLAAESVAVDAAANAEAPAEGLLGLSRTLLALTLDFGLICIGIGMALCIYRLVRGPQLVDRALAVDTLGVELIGMVVLLSMRFNTLYFFDGILVLSLLGFAGTVAMAQYIGRPHIRRLSTRDRSETSRTP